MFHSMPVRMGFSFNTSSKSEVSVDALPDKMGG